MNIRQFLAIAATVLAISACKCDKPFTFIQIADPQLGIFEENSFEKGAALFEKTVAHINEIKPSLVIVTGDMHHIWQDEVEQQAYFDILAKIDKDIPVYHVPGNHDIGDANKQECLDLYHQRYGEDHYSFEFNNTTFLIMNTNFVMHDAKASEEAQFAWMEDVLSKAQGSDHIFVFMHCPIVTKGLDEPDGYSAFPTEKRRRYVDLFKKYNVECLFAGHLHNYFDIDVEGLRLFTCGASGLPIGGFSGYNVVNVTPDNYECDFRPVE